MSAKTSVVLNDSLVAEARRLAGSRTSAAAVHAALREFVRGRNGLAEKKAGKSGAAENNGGRKGKPRPGSWEALAELTREMREGGWDGYDYKEWRRRRWGGSADDTG